MSFVVSLFCAPAKAGRSSPPKRLRCLPRESSLPHTVVVEEETIYSPAPAGNGQAPPACDYVRYLRFRPASDNDTPVPVKAVVIMIPGYIGGAGSFGYLARQLVALGGDTFPVEVWALDRRSNCLEDQTGMQEAEST